MTEYESIVFHESISDVMSYMRDYGVELTARLMLDNFEGSSLDLATAILGMHRGKQVAALFKPYAPPAG